MWALAAGGIALLVILIVGNVWFHWHICRFIKTFQSLIVGIIGFADLFNELIQDFVSFRESGCFLLT